jgi:pimeloyl-ACP methyl ester carboxylesterase
MFTQIRRRAAFAALASIMLITAGIGATEAAPRDGGRMPSGVERAAIRGGATACSDGSGALCGTVKAPLDWRKPSRRTIAVAYKLYLHTGPGEATSAIIPNFGGPGQPTQSDGDAGFMDFLFGPIRDRFDVLLIDNRGTGLSGALNCPSLQQASLPVEQAASDCAKQLGSDLDKYDTASVARDIELIRRNLRIEKLDFYGVSYGAMQAVAYAVRFKEHVRSIVFGSGYTGAGYEQVLSNQMSFIRRVVTEVCDAHSYCGQQFTDPLAALDGATSYLDAEPIEADSIDRFGKPIHVRVDGAKLADLVNNNDATGGLNQGELPAALRALTSGDTAPLARLAALTPDRYGFTAEDAGDPTVFSKAAFLAIDCSDLTSVPWKPGDSTSARQSAMHAAAAAMPEATLSPFRPDDVYSTLPLDHFACSLWPDSLREAPVPQGRSLPDIPVLSFTGRFDSNAPAELDPATAFRRSQTIDVGRVPHAAVFWRCGVRQVQEFLTTLGHVSEECEAPQPKWWARASFPRSRADMTPLDPSPSTPDQSTEADRRLAAAGASTALDAVMQSFRLQGFFTYPGLRGGTITDAEVPDGFTITFDGARFVDDVAVTGTLTLDQSVNKAHADLTIAADDGATGTVALDGEVSLFDRSGEPVTVNGVINGHPVALLSPTDGR